MTDAVRRAYRFRLYPTREQAAELAEWERQLRWLYNLGHEQRCLAMQRPREGRPRVDYFRQSREMTEITRVHEQLARVVCCARQEALRDLDRAWQRFFKRLGGRPRFKNRTDSVRIYLSTPKHWKVEGGSLRLAGAAASVGAIELRQDRPWPGDAKFSSCHLTRDIDEWYAVFPLEHSLDLQKAKAGAVGINRGAVHAIADSMGRVVDSPRYYEHALERIQLLSRRLAKKVKGSRNRHKAAMRLARMHRKVRRQRQWFLHDQSAHYAKGYSTIAIEDLSTRKLVESPAAEEKRHFSVVCKTAGCGGPTYKRRLCKTHYEAQRFIPKALVHRSILDAGWYELGRQLRYKSEARGGRVVAVEPGLAETASIVDGTVGVGGISSTCSGCGAPIPRASGHQYAYCDACAYAAPGDVNAARNVLLRAMRTPPPAPKSPRATIKIKGRGKRSETPAKPAGEACGGDAPVRAPVEAGTRPREGAHPTRTVEPTR